MRELAEPREVAKSFYLASLALCGVACVVMCLRVVGIYDWNHLRRASIVLPVAAVLGLPSLVAALGYLRQRRLTSWVATHIATNSVPTVASVGRLGGVVRQTVYASQARALPALHVSTPRAIVRISGVFNSVESVDVRSLEVVHEFKKVDDAPTLTSVRIWGFVVRVRTHQADGIYVYRTPNGEGLVAYVEREKMFAHASYDFWRFTSSVEEALALAERDAGQPENTVHEQA